MTERQKDFCRWIAEGESVEKAAHKAGYVKKGMGEKLRGLAFVQEEIVRLREEKKVAAETEIAADDEILQFLTHMLRGDGKADLRSRMRAAELLGKKFGLFEKRSEEGSENGVVILDDVT